MNRTRIFLVVLIVFAITSGIFWAKGRYVKQEMREEVDAREIATPALWVVRDADTTIYLFGSVHMLPKGILWLNGPVAKAVNSSDALVMEIAGDIDANAMHDIAKMAVDTNSDPVLLRVAPELRNVTEKAFDKNTLAQYDRMESWAIALDINRRDIESAGYSNDTGVESVIAPYFRDKNKPVTGLETAVAQMQFINDLPADAQSAMLNEAISGRAKAVTRISAYIAAWGKGDLATLEKSFSEDLEGKPAVRERIITQRNKNWAAWVDKRMDSPGTIMMVVGTGHLIGADSVQAMLKPMGHDSIRLQ